MTRHHMTGLRATALAALFALAACAQPGGGGMGGASSFAPPQSAPAKPASLRAAPSPDELMHVDPAAVAAHLGEPDFERKDGDARLWRYSAPACTLQIVFYEEQDGFRSAHLDARKLGGGPAPMGACLTSLVNRPGA